MIFPWTLVTFCSYLVQNLLPYLSKEILAFPYEVACVIAVEISFLADVILVDIVLVAVILVDNFTFR
jgi:hypothetical protein